MKKRDAMKRSSNMTSQNNASRVRKVGNQQTKNAPACTAKQKSRIHENPQGQVKLTSNVTD